MGPTCSSPNNQAPTFGTTLPMPLMQHRSWHNMSNDSHVRQREMHGNAAPPQSNRTLVCFIAQLKILNMYMCISPPFMYKKNQKMNTLYRF